VVQVLQRARSSSGLSRSAAALQRRKVRHVQERVVLLPEAHPRAGQLLRDEGMPIEVAGHVEREVRRHPQAHRPHDRIEHVAVVVEELLATGLDESVVGVPAPRRETWGVGDEGTSLLHAGEYASHPFVATQPSVIGQHHVLFPLAFHGLKHRDLLLGGELTHPFPIPVRPARQLRWLNARDANHIVEEVREVLRPLQPFDVAVQHDAIERGVGELDVTTQKLRQSIHETFPPSSAPTGC